MKLLIFYFIFIYNFAYSQSILINEVVSSNSIIIKDADGDYSDWIELYNASDSTINLSGYSLSDNENNIQKWIFPSIDIQPNQFLIVFASGKNIISPEIHTNFKINSDGEKIILADQNGFIINYIDSVKLLPDISVGRNPNDLSQLLFYPIPTPGFGNGSSGYTAVAENPTFSKNAGFYESDISIELLTFQASSEIHYTLDGSEPSKYSIKYQSPITISTTTVIRAKIFADSLLPSSTITQTFFINEEHTLPIVSLSTDPENFWDDEIGIYVKGTNGKIGDCGDTANYNQDWERPIHIEFFEHDKSNKFSIDAGISIYGGCTRSLSQKSLSIVARGQYGASSIPYKIFPDMPYLEYNSILLRNSGNDNGVSLFRDALMQSLVSSLDIETQAYRPAIVYVNGEYFGIHNIREKHNDNYIFQHHDTLNTEIDFLRRERTIISGDRENYDNLYDYVKDNDLSLNDNYEYVQSQINIENYILYMVSQMYFVNRDWYPNNTKFWRSKNNGKWRWIIFDTDYGYGLYNNESVSRDMLSYVQKEDKYPSVIINGLLENSEFVNQFINRFLDFSNTIFKPDLIVEKIDSFAKTIEPEIHKHINKWHAISSYAEWKENVDDLKSFANNRLYYMTQNFIDNFELNGSAEVTLTTNFESAGSIRLNSIYIHSFPWNGNYFQGIPIELEAIPNSGYEFVKWAGDIDTTSNKIIYTPSKSNIIYAIFKKVEEQYLPQIVFNEIKSKALTQNDHGDWIELYNNSESTINLSNWIFKDEKDDHQFIIPENTYLGKHDYLVVTENINDFTTSHPNVKNIIGDFQFGIKNDGELLRLFHHSGRLVDSVRFMNIIPWPIEKENSSIELINPNFNNNVGENWSPSNITGGTPGFRNSTYYKKFSCSPEINQISVKDSCIKLMWTKCDDSEFSHFEIYRSVDSVSFADTTLQNYYTTQDTFFVDSEILFNQKYFYQIVAVDTNGFRGNYSDISTSVITALRNNNFPLTFELLQNYPNPFNPTTTINYSIPNVETGDIPSQLVIFDVLGREVSTLVNEPQKAGKYSISFDASRLSSGIYYYQLKVGNFIKTKKMALIR